jgi:hypothetical protein
MELSGKNEQGETNPTKKSKLTKTESHNILLYYAKKNIAKVIDAYSTLYQATISAYA